jgi:hypothetical protein
MVLQLHRVLHGTTWWFELQLPQDYWEDLFHATEEHGPQTVSAAYARAKVFWDRMAEENADTLEQRAVPGPQTGTSVRFGPTTPPWRPPIASIAAKSDSNVCLMRGFLVSVESIRYF